MSAEKDRIIEGLKQEIADYKEIIAKIEEAPKIVGVIVAGPEKDNENTYYRCKAGGHEVVVQYTKEVMFKSGVKELEEGTEVLVLNGTIVAVTPKKLKKEEKTPEFDLVDFEEIGGLKSQIETIRDAVEIPLKYESIAKEIGLSPTKGILLYGPPGCGKTLVAKAIASLIIGSKKVDQRAFVYVKGAELLSMYVGATEQRIAEMFRQCREYKKETGKRAVIFIDEAESIMPRRGSMRSSDVEKTIVPTFLAEMDGFEGNNPFILLSTNLPGNIDEAILREGRIDLKIEIKRPTKEDCKEIFEIHFKKVKCVDTIDCLASAGTEALAEKPVFERISGSMIETVAKLSAQNALKRRIADKKAKLGVIEEDVHVAISLLN